MWGTKLLGAKLTGDLGNAPEGTSTSDYCLFPPLAGNLSFGILGLLQQYRPEADEGRGKQFGLLYTGHRGFGECLNLRTKPSPFDKRLPLQ